AVIAAMSRRLVQGNPEGTYAQALSRMEDPVHLGCLPHIISRVEASARPVETDQPLVALGQEGGCPWSGHDRQARQHALELDGAAGMVGVAMRQEQGPQAVRIQAAEPDRRKH